MNEDRQGIDRLRETIESVATGIEARRSGGSRRMALAAAAVLIVVLLSSWFWLAPSSTPEVEVLVLKVHGREMSARIVDDTAPATIIVIPQGGGER